MKGTPDNNKETGYNPALVNEPFSAQAILDYSPDVICVLDKEGRFLYVSAAAVSAWGYEPESLTQKYLLEVVAEADRPLTRQMMEMARNSLVPTRLQHLFRCKDGRLKPACWSLKWNAREEVLYGVARDGEEVIAANEKAKKYEQRLARAYKLAKLGWWEWNIHGDQIETSDELYEICGISKEQYPVFSTGVYLSLVYPDDLASVLEQVAIFWKSTYHQYRHRISKPSGEIIYVELNVQTVKDDNNHVVQVHGTMKDITVQKKSEQEKSELDKMLQQANNNLSMALETMSDGFCTTDHNWTITFMNHRAAAMLGNTERKDYIGRNLWSCFPQAVGTPFYTEYHRAAAENTFVLLEEYYAPLDTWFEVNVYPNANGLSFYIRDVSQRKQQERELLLSNERFRLVAQATSEAIWDWNIADQQVEWGEGFYTIFGYRLDELKKDLDAVIKRIHPDDQERIVESVNKAIEGKESYWVDEYRYRKADNTYAYVADKGFIIRDEHGRAIRMVGAIQDITGQKKQEKRLEFMAKASAELIWERELHTDEVLVNGDKFKAMFGYAIKDHSMPQSFWLEKIHPQDAQTIQDNREYALTHGLDFYLNEYRFQKADGSWAYLKNRIYVIRDFDNQPVSLVGAIEDVTTQRLFEKALIESEKSYRLLFNNGPLPIIICDLKTFCILDVNTVAIDQYGYSREEFLSRTIFDFLPTEEHRRLASFIKQVVPQVRNDLEIMPHIKKNGEQVMVEVSATLIQYKGTAAMLATANDITEKLRLQKQIVAEKINHQKSITKAAIEAQEKERSTIGKELHDNVNQMLAAAKLYVESIRHFADKKEYFIDKSVALLNQSINENRRLSHALVVPRLGDTGFKDTLMEIMQTFQDLKMFDVHYEFYFKEEQLDAGIQLTIYRMLQESFNNTVKYAKATAVYLNISCEGGFLRLVYKDNGIGFDPHTTKMGLGLNNIRNRAEAYNGSMRIISSPGNGYQLHITFPLQPESGAVA